MHGELLGEDAYVDAALRVGVAGFLLKTSTPETLLDAVRRAAAGQALLDPAVTARVIAGYGRPAAPPRSGELHPLTDRETDVLRMVGHGLNNAEVAARLHLGEAMVKTHFGRVLHKLGLRDRAQAVAFAYESGLVRPGG